MLDNEQGWKMMTKSEMRWHTSAHPYPSCKTTISGYEEAVRWTRYVIGGVAVHEESPQLECNVTS